MYNPFLNRKTVQGIFILVCLLFSFASYAQEPPAWNLQTILQYAMQNNINVRRSQVQEKFAGLTYEQSKLSRYPNANFSSNGGLSSGSNQDPTTFSRVTQTYFSSGFNLQSSVDVFNWYSKRNNILANEWEVEAAKAGTDKIKYDIALNAANAYLQILLAKEQEKITSLQLNQSNTQLINTRKMVKAGALPELNATQLEAQVALDSANYITAKGAVTQNTLLLKNLMSIDPGAPFVVETPAITNIPIQPIGSLQPEDVYAQAIANQPQQRFNDLKLKAASFATRSAKGAMYPTIGMYGTLSTNYLAFKKQPFFSQNVSGFSSTPFFVNVNGQDYAIQQPIFTQGAIAGFARPDPFFSQLDNNFRQGVGVSLSVPIFNAGQLRTNYKRSKLNEESLSIQKDQDNLQLKQDIYSAYTAAVIALEKLNASRKALSSSEISLGYAQKRYDIGVLNTFELITTQNNVLRARLEYSINEFDYVFKMKVLEFYKGQGLSL